MEWTDNAFLLSCRPFGETVAIAQVLSRHHGRYAGLIHGGQSRSKQGLLQPGNLLEVRWKARLQEQLGHFVCELQTAYGARILNDPDRLAAMTSALALLEVALAEREPHEDCYQRLQIFLEDLASPDAWLNCYLAWEYDLLSSLGYGLPSFASELRVTRSNSQTLFDLHTWKLSKPALDGVEERNGQQLALPSWLADKDSGDRYGRNPTPAEFGEALDFFATLLRLRVFHPMERELPPARQRLAARFAGSSKGVSKGTSKGAAKESSMESSRESSAGVSTMPSAVSLPESSPVSSSVSSPESSSASSPVSSAVSSPESSPASSPVSS